MELETSQVTARQFELAMSRRNKKGQQRRAQIGGETTLLKQISGETRKQQQYNKSPLARRLQSAGISEGQRRPRKTSSSIQGDEG